MDTRDVFTQDPRFLVLQLLHSTNIFSSTLTPKKIAFMKDKISNSTAYYIPELFPNQSQNSKDEILKDLFSVNIKKNNGLPDRRNSQTRDVNRR